MKRFSKGDVVSWEWGNGSASGVIEDIAYETKQIQSKGETIKRNGSQNNPALVIKQRDGTKVLKLAHELR